MRHSGAFGPLYVAGPLATHWYPGAPTRSVFVTTFQLTKSPTASLAYTGVPAGRSSASLQSLVGSSRFTYRFASSRFTSIATCLHVPLSHISSVHAFPSSAHDCPCFAGFGTHFVPLLIMQPAPLLPGALQASHVPGAGGFPAECQPPLMMPTPGSDASTVPSAETEPVPMATN